MVVTTVGGTRPLDDTPLPLPVALAVGALTALAASYAVGPEGARGPRLAVLASAPALAVLTHW